MSTESKLSPYDVALYQYFGSTVSVNGYLAIIDVRHLGQMERANKWLKKA
jgi:hypothetical protein